jgi:nucleoside-diphosphate kinase
MAVERTFFLIKPNGVERGLVGEIVARIERRGLVIRGLKLMQVSTELAEAHYEEHRERPFFGELVDFITSGPVVAMVVEGQSAISVMRTMIGATNPVDAAPGTIRGDYALEMGENICHGSDAPESAEREIELYFTAAELGLARA